MKTYPSIQFSAGLHQAQMQEMHFYVFDKLDGSNLRAEWTRKNGFSKFGTRRRLLDDSDPILGSGVKLILDKYGDDLSRIFREQRWNQATAYFEFYGPQSFVGQHAPDDEHTVTLIDVNVHKKGLVMPNSFVKLFRDVELPNIVHQGPIDEDFIMRVIDGEIEGVTFEGVVAKASPLNKTPSPVMFKIKTREWLDRLRGFCKEDKALFDKLR